MLPVRVADWNQVLWVSNKACAYLCCISHVGLRRPKLASQCKAIFGTHCLCVHTLPVLYCRHEVHSRCIHTYIYINYVPCACIQLCTCYAPADAGPTLTYTCTVTSSDPMLFVSLFCFRLSLFWACLFVCLLFIGRVFSLLLQPVSRAVVMSQ